MKPPIIISENDSDIYIFSSIQEVGIYLDPVDYFVNPPPSVRIIAYDSLGYVLDLSKGFTEVKYQFLFLKWKRRYRGVKLTKKIPEENREAELRKTLIDFLSFRKLGQKEDFQKNTLEELIQKADW